MMVYDGKMQNVVSWCDGNMQKMWCIGMMKCQMWYAGMIEMQKRGVCWYMMKYAKTCCMVGMQNVVSWCDGKMQSVVSWYDGKMQSVVSWYDGHTQKKKCGMLV
jgi:hypothetical protein